GRNSSDRVKWAIELEQSGSADGRRRRQLNPARLPMRSLILSFFVLITLSAAFLAVGLIIAFWPATYLRWVRWSRVEHYAPWLVRGWGVSRGHHGWRVRIVGIG